MIKFGEWMPDQPDFQNAGSTEAQNVLPSASGYAPIKTLEVLSGAADNRIRGIFPAKDNSGNIKLFIGDAGKLYEFDASDSGLDSIGKGGGYTLSDDEYWKFVQFGDRVIAAGGTGETLQSYVLGSSSAFADVSGSPKAKFIASVRDFIMSAYIDEGSGEVPYLSLIHI